CRRLAAALRLPATGRPTDLAGELGEELVGELARRAIDQPLADLGELTADLGFDVVDEQRAAILWLQLHGGAPLVQAPDAALASAGNLVAVGRIEIAQPHLAFEARFDRADLVGGDRLELGVRQLVQRLAAGDADLQHLRVVQLLPDGFLGRPQLNLAGHVHRHRTASCRVARRLDFVMPGLVPGIHVLAEVLQMKTWMSGTSPAMTMIGRSRLVSVFTAQAGGWKAPSRHTGSCRDGGAAAVGIDVAAHAFPVSPARPAVFERRHAPRPR